MDKLKPSGMYPQLKNNARLNPLKFFNDLKLKIAS
jgi:hypothetical protein